MERTCVANRRPGSFTLLADIFLETKQQPVVSQEDQEALDLLDTDDEAPSIDIDAGYPAQLAAATELGEITPL